MADGHWGTDGFGSASTSASVEEIGEDGEGEDESEEEEEEEGELVGFIGVDMQTGEVYWDDEDAAFGSGEISGGPAEGAEVAAQRVEGLAKSEESSVLDQNAGGDDDAAEGVVSAVL